MNTIYKATYNSFRSVIHSCIYVYVDSSLYKEVVDTVYHPINKPCCVGGLIQTELRRIAWLENQTYESNY